MSFQQSRVVWFYLAPLLLLFDLFDNQVHFSLLKNMQHYVLMNFNYRNNFEFTTNTNKT